MEQTEIIVDNRIHVAQPDSVIRRDHYKMQTTRKKLNAKEEYFIYNGTLLLEKQISTHQGKGKGPEEQLTTFSVQDILQAINNCDDRTIITGEVSTVYKGTLEGRTVAIKIFPGLYPTIDTEWAIDFFLNQVTFKLQINHKNVVKLYGCCLETRVPVLVYEFVSNGTLYDHLHGTSHAAPRWISWLDRLRIASEISHVLSYMHLSKATPIVHRDVKSANIFLDEFYAAKLTNFGFSVSLKPQEPSVSVPVGGSMGYVDPEHLLTGRVTEKCDVYSFGVLLVELLTSMKPYNRHSNLVDYFVSCQAKNNSSGIVHRRVLEEGSSEEIEAYRELALKCIRRKGGERPTMKEVTIELRRILNLARSRQATSTPQPFA